jgi:hypothetical protein
MTRSATCSGASSRQPGRRAHQAREQRGVLGQEIGAQRKDAGGATALDLGIVLVGLGHRPP